jgi:hypothetical protein
MRRSICILSCREPGQDFRTHLATALRGEGHEVTMIWLRRRPLVQGPKDLGVRRTSWRQVLGMLRPLGRDSEAEAVAVLNTTNLAFVATTLALRQIMGPNCVWLFDLHDDLLYGAKGWRRSCLAAKQRLTSLSSDHVIAASPLLKEIAPKALVIRNASPLLPNFKRAAPDRVLVLASFDDRFDFGLMRGVAAEASDRHFDLFGRVSANDAEVASKLTTLVSDSPNVRYHGQYYEKDLQNIFDRYLVSYAPYDTDSRLNDRIDPIRFQHCFRSHTGVVSTSIPAARLAASNIIVHDAAEGISEALNRAIAARQTSAGRSWQHAAQELATFLDCASR